MTFKNILLVDDHEIFLSGVSALVSTVFPELRQFQANCATEAIDILEHNQIDLIILDHELPDTNGLELVPRLKRENPDTRIVMLTGAHSGSLVLKLIEAGADAVLAKRGKGDELIDFINAKFAKGYISESFGSQIDQSRVLTGLTKRERECFELLLQGLSTKQIAEKMSVSFKTAETHRTRLMAKLDVHTYGELIALAQELGVTP